MGKLLMDIHKTQCLEFNQIHASGSANFVNLKVSRIQVDQCDSGCCDQAPAPGMQNQIMRFIMFGLARI